MQEIDDGDEWRARALRDPALPAHVLLCLRHPSMRPLVDPHAAPTEEAAPAGWGSHGRRSRMITLRGVRDAKEEEDEEAASAREAMRASPMTPLDFSGGAGTSESGGSGGEERSAAKRSRSAEPAAVLDSGGREAKEVDAGERAPLVFRIPDPKPMRRPVKKKTIPELQAVEKSLLEQRGMLQKEVEARRRAHAAVVAENQRLKRVKLTLESQRVPSTGTLMPEEAVQPKQLQLQPRDAFVPLPDLNIPLFAELD